MIDYFDFIKQYPDIIDIAYIGYMDTDFINHVHQMNDNNIGDKTILGIDFTRLSDLILDDKINKRDTILTKNISIGLFEETFFCIKQTDGLTICEKNNMNEKIGRFHIKINNWKGYRNLKEVEINSIKRSVLIDKILSDGKDS